MPRALLATHSPPSPGPSQPLPVQGPRAPAARLQQHSPHNTPRPLRRPARPALRGLSPHAAASPSPSSSPPPPPTPPLPTPPAPTIITSLPDHLAPSVLSNALLLLDKPPNWEVPEIVASVQRATGAPKLASLAPLDASASGLLLLAFGDATKLLARRVEGAAKSYEGSMVLGASAGSGDVRGGSLAADALPWGHVTDEELQEVADSLVTSGGGGGSSESGVGGGGSGGGSVSGGPALQLLPLRQRLRQLPSSFSYVEEDIGPSVLTLPMQLREFRVWRQSEVPAAASPAGPGPAPRPALVSPPRPLAPAPAKATAGADGRTDSRFAAAGDPAGGGGGAGAVYAGAALGRGGSVYDDGGGGVYDGRADGSGGGGGGAVYGRTHGGVGGGGGGRVVRFVATVAGRTHLRPLVTLYGRRLRTTAVLDELRRTGVGPFSVEDAWAAESLLPLLERYRGWWAERRGRSGGKR